MDQRPIQLTFEMSKRGLPSLRAGALRVKESINEALRRSLDGCGMDREGIARELSRLVGEEISVHTINNWCAEGKGNRRLPLEYAKALAIITGNAGVIQAALGPEFTVLNREQTEFYELGMIVAEERAVKKRKRKITERIGI